ncbi:MAG: phosphate transport system regulatory protein PhoU [Syntrophus sp. (in: bacteria)]|nr:phosphate transport system regulatory protein PhoU [Syntrophus sp. (in: bacteria)]
MLEDRINALRRELIEYAALVEKMIEKSVNGLLQIDKELLQGVINTDEPKANAFEIDLDELCTTMIAQYQPKAKDLRTTLMVYKMNNDLERMGDHAVTISQNSLFLIEQPSVKRLIDIPRMAEITINMVQDSINAFVNEDAQLAKTVLERDDLVDGLIKQIIRELITHMIENPKTIERAMRLITIARNLERIADLSTNISEDVIFMVKGVVIKHHKSNE